MKNPLDQMFEDAPEKKNVRSTTREILDDVFGMDDEVAETFLENVHTQFQTDTDTGDDIGFDTVEKYNVKSPEFTVLQQGFIRVKHGVDGTDYVWHISPHHPKKPWAARPEHLLLAIKRVFTTVVPPTTRMWIWSPEPEWEILEWTFKAVKLMEAWSVSQEDIDAMNKQLLEVCNSMV